MAKHSGNEEVAKIKSAKKKNSDEHTAAVTRSSSSVSSVPEFFRPTMTKTNKDIAWWIMYAGLPYNVVQSRAFRDIFNTIYGKEKVAMIARSK